MEYISDRTAIIVSVSTQATSMQPSSYWSVAWAYILLRTVPLTDSDYRNDATSLTTYTTHTRINDTNIYYNYIYIHILHASNPYEPLQNGEYTNTHQL